MKRYVPRLACMPLRAVEQKHIIRDAYVCVCLSLSLSLSLSLFLRCSTLFSNTR